MPLPKPRKGEKKPDFIDRCMADPNANKEFPDPKKRSGYCYGAWDDRNKQEAPQMSHRPGHEWMLSAPLFGSDIPLKAVDPKEGVLRGVAIVTEGEAQGHDVFLDEEFVDATIKAGNAIRTGLKARFGHPTMSSTALGTFLGRAKHFRRDEWRGQAVARADLFLSNSAAEAPSGDLRAYVLKLAAEDPKALGMSIVFTQGQGYRRTPNGKKVRQGDDDWKEAPPKDYAELKALHGVDAVDEPAANPNGLFAHSPWSRETFAGQVAEFLDTHPDVFTLLHEHPEVLEGFLARYRAHLARKENVVAEEPQAGQKAAPPEPETLEPEAPTTEHQPTTEEADASETVEKLSLLQKLANLLGLSGAAATPQEPQPAPPSTPPPAIETRPDGPAFVQAFGEAGAVVFAQGGTFAEAATAYRVAMEAKLKAATEQLDASQKAKAELEQRLGNVALGIPPEDAPAAQAEPSPEETALGKLVKSYMANAGLSEEEAKAKAEAVIKLRG